MSFGMPAARASAGSASDEFPKQSIRLVVPFPAGGSSDSIARMLADGLGKELGESVFIDNRPGASTNLGSEWVAKSRADGYTLLFGGTSLGMNAIFGPKPNFDLQEMLVPVSTVAELPFVLAIKTGVPARNSREFVDAARAEPGKYSIASAQLDTYVERLKIAANMDVLHVPYKGGAQVVTDTMSGQVDAAFALVPVVLPHLQAGKLRAVAISSHKRLTATLPSVPTFAESGVDFVVTVWYGVQAPAGVDPDRLEILNQAIRKVVDAPDFVARLAEIGAKAGGSSAEEMGGMLARQREAWVRLSISQPQLVR